ncbi:MAG: MATE family efflux transporter [Clostridium sp.]|uniref:MATE family efflux transporter n=1 Tax=Clostridium sp. TaxID=1506 RepID=UPI002A8844E1|nr:MATE family efflux transporter [Clostridium sp.]MDY5097004.1 MATE family efflux transporter [Clostridium sp.]
MDSSSSLMTEGCIWRKIVKFALPICWGNLFQQLYNIVDSVVVGNYVGRDALAAISSTGSLIFLLVGFFGGIFMGAGVVISKYFGANKKESVQKAIHTSIAFAIIAGIILTVVGTLLTPQILRLMGTPDSVFSNATLYVRIYFMGILSVVLYNTSSGIFQAVGDSKHPLYYLIISSIVNVVLDLIFVVIFKWGIGGAAFATIISQTVSVVLSFYKLSTTNDVYKVDFKKIEIDPRILKEIIRLGLPAGIQNSVIALANVVVQANINAFGSVAMAGCGSYSKIEGFVFIPITSFAMSMTTFIGQNLGAKKYDRAKEGAKFGIITSIILAEIIGVLFFILAPQLISLFNGEPEVVQFGTSQSRTIALFYFLLAFSHCIAGILRGAGKAIVPMFVMLLCWCIIRVTYITITTHFIPMIQVVFWAYPLTWFLSSMIFLIYYLKSDWIHGFDKK